MTAFPYEVVTIIICQVLLALVSLAEAAMVSISKVRLHSLIESGNETARLVNRLTDDRHSLLAILIIILNVCILTSSAFSTSLFHRLFEEKWIPLLHLVVIMMILVLFEVPAKAFGLRHAERMALLFAKPLAALIWLFSPIIWVVTRAGRGIIRGLVVPVLGGEVRQSFAPLTDEEIKQLLAVGESSGELEEDEREMLHSAIEFADKVAREVMVPRTDMVCLEETMSVSEAVKIGVRSGFSRLPVFRGDLDHIVGILYLRDLLPRLINGSKEMQVGDLMRPPYSVPESKKIDELLRDMQGRRTHMAIVIDEYGGVSGLVTIEDILEEIVGEIRDEYDVAEEEPLTMIEEGTFIALGRLSTDDLDEEFNLEVPEGDYDTLGGFLTDRLGRLPEVGDKVTFGALLFEIEEMHEQRVERVRITRQAQEEVPDEEAQ